MIQLRQPLVYVVDDDQAEHYLLQTFFSRHYPHCTLRCFGDGTELVIQLTHRLDGRLPDLILLDWHLPILGGHQVLQLLKNDADWRSIPVVVRSSCPPYGTVDSGDDGGAQAYLLKGSGYQQLADSVRALL